MSDTSHDHEIVSIYAFTEQQIDTLMREAQECVLMWGTKDGWPVCVVHAFVWHQGKIWLTFAAHRYRAAAILTAQGHPRDRAGEMDHLRRRKGRP